MNITEFAIGNYVLLNGQPERIRGIQEDQFEKCRHVILLGQGKVPLWYTLKEIQQIGIDSDILFALNFDYHRVRGTDFSAYQLWNEDYMIDDDGILRYSTYECATISSNVNYLHDLQNVLYMNFGFKLTIDYEKLKAAI